MNWNGLDQRKRNDDALQQHFWNLLRAVVPEKAHELDQLLASLDLRIELLESDGILFQGGSYRFVQFNHRAARLFWLGSFIAWEVYESIALSTGSPVPPENMNARLESFNQLLESEDESGPWPEDIPEPGASLESMPIQNRAPADVARFSLAWGFLHEIMHVKHQREQTNGDCLLSEELSCDAFATSFILEGVESFAQQSSDDVAVIRHKRELGIYFALFSMSLMAKGKWHESKSHPAMQSRIDWVRRLMGPERSEMALAQACALFLTLQNVWPGAPGVL